MGMPIQYENKLLRMKPEDRRRARRYMKMGAGRKIWKISAFFTEVIFRLPAIRQAEEHSRNGGKAFMYYWTKPSALPYLGACHAVELGYVFGNGSDTIYTRGTGGSRSDPPGAGSVGPVRGNRRSGNGEAAVAGPIDDQELFDSSFVFYGKGRPVSDEGFPRSSG